MTPIQAMDDALRAAEDKMKEVCGGKSVKQILSMIPPNITEEQRASAVKFYLGAQWDPAVSHARELKKRPVLVVNYIPQFVGAAQLVSEAKGERFTDEDRINLRIALVLLLKDLQQLANYAHSTKREWESIHIERCVSGNEAPHP